MKKCLVLDLDNTLWGGIVGEDGIDGIKLGLQSPGNYFLAFQQAILDLANRGIILAINSRNNEEDAMQVIREHPNMILKQQHFAAMRINWKDKATNIQELARELNIGTDAMVFLDDDRANCALVRAILPEVEVPDLPDEPEQYAKFLLSLPYFPADAATDEDKMRVNMYVTERLRSEAAKNFSSREEFLRSLQTEVHCSLDDPSCLTRLSQLTEKTNQFNTNKVPLGEAEIARYINDPNYAVFHARANDKFGDHGIIGFALARKNTDDWVIESMLMSCRILGKGIEESFLSGIAQTARAHGANSLSTVFKQTEKNKPAEDFINQHFNNLKLSLLSDYPKPDWINFKWTN